MVFAFVDAHILLSAVPFLRNTYTLPAATARSYICARFAGVIGSVPSGTPKVETFKKVQFQQVYPGVDLVYYGNQQHLEYDFIVAPSASPETIALSFSGADSVGLTAQGTLVIVAQRRRAGKFAIDLSGHPTKTGVLPPGLGVGGEASGSLSRDS